MIAGILVCLTYSKTHYFLEKHMGYRQLDIKLPTGFSESVLKQEISKVLKISAFSYEIISQSLDARLKTKVHWLLRVGVYSSALPGEEPAKGEGLVIPYRKRKKKVFVLGSGPAGMFAALVLQKAGFDTLLAERGSAVDKRSNRISRFEQNGLFDENANYAFGEGGAGTFSDGKLTSRSKHISAERRFITETYISAGAPAEIAWLAHPHIGSDNLQKVVATLRKEYQSLGGSILFETCVVDINTNGRKVTEILTSSGRFDADIHVFAPGHSAYDTFRMLMRKGVLFRMKNFAIGSRAEHPQELINRAQWGVERLQGVKAAEYRLTYTGLRNQPVYTFCMCPGGIIVPATAFAHSNIVNGMSFYARGGKFSNAACVAGLHPSQLDQNINTPLDALDHLENLEQSFYNYAKGYSAPACTIMDFMKGRSKGRLPQSSFPLGIVEAPLWELLPSSVVSALRVGLADFSSKVKGYHEGTLVGLESKTSSPIQVVRDKSGLVDGFDNLFVVGEGSGYAGGIMSSAADGIKAAMAIVSADF